MENKVVVLQIEKVLRQEFGCYGYKNMTAELPGMGWIINHKKSVPANERIQVVVWGQDQTDAL